MTDVITLSHTTWDQSVTATEQAFAIEALERGCVLCFPQLNFPIQDAQLLSPAVAAKAKNISLDPATGLLRGNNISATDQQALQKMMARFASSSKILLQNLLPHYERSLLQARTSFRPMEVAGRSSSWRKDDSRLHVDSFPSSPTQGNRILRVFTNINPHGQSRDWRLGESFENVSRRFLPSLSKPIWGSARLLKLLGITKRRRTAYDHYMLQLHDRMKADCRYQTEAPQAAYQFQPGSTWMVFTDLVSHAAMSGQYMLEQTYHLPVNSMLNPAQAPLRILENLLERELV